MLSRELEVSLNLAFKDARSQRHELMSVEHLLLALLDNTAAVNVLTACNANIEKLKTELTNFVAETTPLISEEQEGRNTAYSRVPTSIAASGISRAKLRKKGSDRRARASRDILRSRESCGVLVERPRS